VTRRGPTVHLLPNFDEYLVAYQDREPITRGIVARVALSRGDLLTNRVIVDGIVVGTWKRTQGSRGVAVEIALTEEVGAGALRAIRAAADAYGSFLQRPIECPVRR
jgi:Winged helix DNA-binding domain